MSVGRGMGARVPPCSKCIASVPDGNVSTGVDFGGTRMPAIAFAANMDVLICASTVASMPLHSA